MYPLRNTKSSTQGDRCVKVLLDAERRGNDRIKQAQTYRVKIIKQAKIDAEIEKNAFQKQKDDIIKEKLRQIEHDIELEKIVYDRQVDATIKGYDERVAQVKDRVIENLLDLVTNIKPEIHHNFTVQKEINETGTYTRIFDSLHSGSRY
uniref:V-type proton ATPase subunit G n=1 Tax=Panagrolaimus davidi TaxID=227884 RepID=A0A914P9M9_9BILA